ncbi:hypothetical protein SMD44_04737 [Streptomyces alboflavus]|uniref:Uncharacterized protein n=2 Tax=Streptomyces TaxID=1883 RepID=A0A1Z1WFX4_9ACTN|nr:hypothetical protein SMD44_04737 [Streptomyces alboflavus]
MTGHATTERGPAGPNSKERLADGRVEVRIIAADPDAARLVAQALSGVLVCDEPRSYPAGGEGCGTRLHLTVDTLRARLPDPAPRSWFTDSRSQAQRTHGDETT